MLSLDDYFMVEVEKKETDPDTGKKVTRKVRESKTFSLCSTVCYWGRRSSVLPSPSGEIVLFSLICTN